MKNIVICFIFFCSQVSLYSLSKDLPVIHINDSTEFVELRENIIGIYIDQSNQQTIETISKLPEENFQLNQPLFNGKTKSSYWLKFKIKSNTRLNSKWVLEVLDSRHNEIELYSPNHSNGFDKNQTGLKYPFEKRLYGHKNFVMDIIVPEGEINVYYLKIKSEVVGSLLCKLRSNHEFSAYAFNEYYLLGIFYGILLIIAIYNLLIFITIKEHIYLYYTFYILVWAFHSMIDDGVGYQYLWTNYPIVSKIGFYISRPLLITLLVLYSRMFLNTYTNFKKVDKIILGSTALYIITHIFSSINNSMNISNYVFMIPLSVIFYTSIQAYKKGYKPARFFLLGHSFILLTMFIRILKDGSVIEMLTESVTIYIISIYSQNLGVILDIIIVSLALADRIRYMKELQEKAQAKIIQQLQENELLSQKVNRELEQKVSERTEELKQTADALRSANEKLKDQAEQINKMNQMLDLDNYNLQRKVKEATEARIKFKDVSFEEFSNIFPDDLSCQRYLEEIKWKNGYHCRKCNNEKHCDGNKKFSRRCTKCRYTESVTAYTLLHKCKFDLSKALFIIVKINRHDSDINIQELSRELDMRNSTVWSFKEKILEAKRKQKNKSDDEEDNLANLLLQY